MIVIFKVQNSIKMINELAEKSYKIAKANGFYKRGVNTTEVLCHIQNEVSEAIIAHSTGDYIYTSIKAVNGWRDDKDFIDSFENNVKDSFQDELADIIILVMSLSKHESIDLESHVKAKMRYNELREYINK